MSYLTDLYNLSVKEAVIPDIWKTALVLPVPKPGKPADQGTSYRPIFLLSPVMKILERLVLPSLTAAFTCSPTQHGFRPNRSTTTALLPLASQISEGFNSNKPAKRTAAVAVDISIAFDSVDITLLLKQISGSDLNHNLVRWLSSYLWGRMAACIYQGKRSKFRTVHIGVPQGCVLSPCLLNFFTSDFPVVSDLLASFADDFTIGASDALLVNIEASLNADLIPISKWAKAKRLKISEDKSKVTYFTPWNRENADPKIYYEGLRIPVENSMKVLGVIFDIHHTFTPHIKSQGARARKLLCIIKAVMGTKWGFTKEDGLLTYKALIAPILSYAAPVWLPARSQLKHPVNPLQSVQNAALCAPHRLTCCISCPASPQRVRDAPGL
jgi:hypothetical protein